MIPTVVPDWCDDLLRRLSRICRSLLLLLVGGSFSLFLLGRLRHTSGDDCGSPGSLQCELPHPPTRDGPLRLTGRISISISLSNEAHPLRRRLCLMTPPGGAAGS